jgi:ribosomal protein S17
MKHAVRMFVAVGVVVTGLAACKSKTPEVAQQPQTPAPAPMTPGQAAPPATGLPPGGQMPAAATAGKLITGKVAETMDAGTYTYVQVDDGKTKVWAAAPQFKVKKGDTVTVPEGMPMANYKSTTLNRTFDVVYFVGAIGMGDQLPAGAAPAASPMAAMPPMGGAGDQAAQMPEGAHPRLDPSQAAKDANVTFSGIKKADKTVADIYGGKSGLAGKDVSVRGKVVKFSPQIMGKNWIHVQDGTGQAGSNDLTVTTLDEAKVGDTVLITGKITLNKDFGMGYKYDLIIEDGKVKVE